MENTAKRIQNAKATLQTSAKWQPFTPVGFKLSKAMNIKYKGDPDDLFSVNLIDKIQVKSIIDSKWGKAEHWGENVNEETGRTYEFGGVLSSGIYFDIEDDLLAIYSSSGYMAAFDPKAKSFKMSLADHQDFLRPQTYKVDARLIFIVPRTMKSFSRALELFILRLHQEAFNRKFLMDTTYYDLYNCPPHDPEEDDPMDTLKF